MVGPLNREVLVHPDLETACRALATDVVAAGKRAFERQSRFSLVIPGGETPKTLFHQLTTEFPSDLPWKRVDVFWTDERAVGPDDPSSNFGLAQRTLLAPLGLGPPNVHRMRGERRPLGYAAREYEQVLREFFHAEPGGVMPPTSFDFVILGLGRDGHTASIFPGASPSVREGRWVEATASAPGPPRVPRITLTPEALDRAREVAFLVGGPEKAAIVKRVLESQLSDSSEFPAARIRATERLRWYLDAQAMRSV
ncbi:MAG: 6-phosphogluconolactonase [Thermoplasmata archaeon]